MDPSGTFREHKPTADSRNPHDRSQKLASKSPKAAEAYKRQQKTVHTFKETDPTKEPYGDIWGTSGTINLHKRPWPNMNAYMLEPPYLPKIC